MSHDFAKAKKGKPKKASSKNARKKTQGKAIPGWALFLSGVLFTLFAELLIYLSMIDVDKKGTEKPAKKEEKVQEEKAAKKPPITFYKELPDMEVKVPDDVVAPREQGEYNYILQAGAFKNEKDAEQQRAEIILLGLDATIEKGKDKSGTLWHKVIVGPFASRSALSSARSTLVNNDIPTLKVKR